MDIGIDIGGSHIGVGVVSTETGEIFIKKEKEITKREIENYKSNAIKLNTTVEDDYYFEEKVMKKYILDTIFALIKEVKENLSFNYSLDQAMDFANRHDNKTDINEKLSQIERIGIASPGKIENGTILDLYNLGIKKFNIKEDLEIQFKGTKVSIRNDATCAGLAEKEFGSLKNVDDGVFLCLGTGIGGSIFYNGKLLEPKKFAGAEFGHMIIEKGGKKCKCGNSGCWERYASMKAFKNGLRKKLDCDEELDGKELYDLFKKEYKNNKEIDDYVEEYLDNVLIGIINISNILSPEKIAIGGGFIHYKELYSRLMEKMQENKYSSFMIPQITLAKLGNDAGLIGACL